MEATAKPISLPPATLRAYAWEYMRRASLQPLGSKPRAYANAVALQLAQAADSGVPLGKALVWAHDGTYAGARYPGTPAAPHSAQHNPHAKG